ncbi:ankyrin repeat domain-containing protein 49 isoform X2 [Struthio camelus]|uniref:ankyrin repeat domain-containing protein 49 isoform X2 n=1 Tax=Struthio camelus TaxID=8801 RepID=UPI003603B164
MSEGKRLDEKGAEGRDEDSEPLADFTENFNQLELLETHRHLIPVGTQSCWSGQSEDEEDEQEKSEEWYEMQEKKMEKNPEKLLLWAAENNRLSTVRRLLSQKLAPVNARDEDQYTPLHRAAYSGHLDIARELVAQGADVHALTVDGWTPLHSALQVSDKNHDLMQAFNE